MSNSMNVVLRCKKAEKETVVDWASLPEASQAAIIRYGAMRFINDKLGGMEPEEAAEKYEEILAQLMAGWEGRAASGQSGEDAITKKAKALARDQIKQAILASGRKLKDVPREKLTELANNLFEKDADGYRKQAERIISAEAKARKEAAQVVDLDSLGL
jgi:hypothetical protein